MDVWVEPFFLRALAGGLLVGLMLPAIGVILVLRRLSMIGDSLAHASVAGVALGLLIGVWPLAAGLGFALATGFAVEWLRRAYRAYAELAVAITMSGGVALAAFLFTLGRGFNLNVSAYLFGSVYTLSGGELAAIGGVTAVVLAMLVALRKEWYLLAFDEEAAHVGGLPVQTLNGVLTALAATAIAVAIKIVGALLVSALLVIPAAISLAVADGFRRAAAVAIVSAETAIVVGLLAAGAWNLAPGATVVLTLLVLLAGAVVWARRRSR
ncbi:MAG: metal ABC transporter permease [Candidatus Reconcilbacillus cellulovorans]|uniref:Metal ABC transporter permease n=1 Tax=Candidatus Reconcilbacillus cellulovorans TaxID=1906605 RepID=A0A2A6E0J7_9BACL|nr:MAG: metal ABC transporter permease [Candidatus Reconcilbacillus cellulovorans]